MATTKAFQRSYPELRERTVRMVPETIAKAGRERFGLPPGVQPQIDCTVKAVGARCVMVRLSPALALAGAGLFGPLVRDVVLTKSEVQELMNGILVSRGPAACPTSFSSGLGADAPILGRSGDRIGTGGRWRLRTLQRRVTTTLATCRYTSPVCWDQCPSCGTG